MRRGRSRHGRADPWGVFNGGRGHPAAQYCANLGHPTDAETGLVYMRARYYEPWTGRFLSEDPARDGRNWYSYCGNEPVSKTDFSGTIALNDLDTINSIIEDVCKFFGWRYAPPRLLALSLEHYSKMVALMAVDALGNKLILIGITGVGGGGVFTQGPLLAGAAGAALFGGAVVSLLANLSGALLTYQFMISLYLLDVEMATE